jgi:hypothetical protein
MVVSTVGGGSAPLIATHGEKGWTVKPADTADAAAMATSDPMDIAARALMVEARKKGGFEAVRHRLNGIAMTAKFDGAQEAEKRAMENAAEVRAVMDAEVVNGFMAAAYHHMIRADDLSVLMITQATLRRVYDALDAAGYGKNGSARKRIMARGHEEVMARNRRA